MAKFGKDIYGGIHPDILKSIRGRAPALRNRVYLNCENDDNLIWLATMDELSKILLADSTWHIVQHLTGFTRDWLSRRLDELREIRNVIGHNRAASQQTLTLLESVRTGLKPGLLTFRRLMLCGGSLHMDEREEDLVVTFTLNKCREFDWGELMPIISDSKYFYSLEVTLQGPLGFLRLSRLLEALEPLTPKTLALVVWYHYGLSSRDREGSTTFDIVWPKALPIEEHQALVTTVFDLRNRDPLDQRRGLLTDVPFDLQHPAYVGHPKIWFTTQTRKETGVDYSLFGDEWID